MANTYLTQEIANYTQGGETITRHYVLINGCYEAWIDVNAAGEFVNGTFKKDTDASREMLEHVTTCAAPLSALKWQSGQLTWR